jgi:hypothetical protein
MERGDEIVSTGLVDATIRNLDAKPEQLQRLRCPTDSWSQTRANSEGQEACRPRVEHTLSDYISLTSTPIMSTEASTDAISPVRSPSTTTRP